jgi:uncharacterized protein
MDKADGFTNVILVSQKKADFSRFLRGLWSDGKPLMKLFRTDSRGYVYDTGTNRIFACGEVEFNLLNNLMSLEIEEALEMTASTYTPVELLKALDAVRTEIQEKNILKTKRSISFAGAHFDGLKEFVQNHLEMIQLEITERCNLRCVYCIYNPHFTEKRNYGTRDMSLKTAFSAIDHLAHSSKSQKHVAVTFYGGEPLLCFPLIKSCVKYARKVMPKKDLGFSITTNATLITPSIARFFAKESFGVHASIDGPEDVHNEYRRDANGVGSFQETISGLRMLYDAYGVKKEGISLSMVYTPPYSSEKINRIAGLWEKYPWLPRNIGHSISYAQGPLPPSISYRTKGNTKRDYSLIDWALERFIEDYKKGNQPSPISSSIAEKEMAKLFQRKIYSAPLQTYFLNGCCVPSARKQFVSVDGTFMLCERIGIAPAIGNVATGVDLENLKKIYVEEYASKSIPTCQECWALQNCSLCYIHSFSQGRINLELKQSNCLAMRERILKFLILYCSLIEIRPSGLDYLAEWELT